MNLEIFITPEPNRNNSFWFYGLDIAQKTVNGVTYFVRAAGELRVQFDENTVLDGDAAVEYARLQNLNDRDIKELYDEDQVLGANWFTVYSEEGDESPVELSVEPTTYDDAIEALQEFVDAARQNLDLKSFHLYIRLAYGILGSGDGDEWEDSSEFTRGVVNLLAEILPKEGYGTEDRMVEIMQELKDYRTVKKSKK